MKSTLFLIWTTLVCLCAGCDQDKRDYDSLCRLSKNDPSQAAKLALRLSQTTNGVLWAAKNLTLYGGPNRGANTLILVESPLTNVVVHELKRIIEQPHNQLDKRIEAAWILWLKSPEVEHTYLDQIYGFVRSPAGDEVAIHAGRRYLLKVIADEKLISKVDLPASKQLPLSEQEFMVLIREPGATVENP